jgi:hypothetical protein
MHHLGDAVRRLAVLLQNANNHGVNYPLRLSGNYVPPDLIISNSVLCIYTFHMILNVKSDYFLKQH